MILNAYQRLIIGRRLLREKSKEKGYNGKYYRSELERVRNITDKFIDLEHENQHFDIVFRQVFGDVKHIPREYKKVIWDAISRSLEKIRYSMLDQVSNDLNSSMWFETYDVFIRNYLQMNLPCRSFVLDGKGKILNIHTGEVIDINEYSTIGEIIHMLQLVAREIRIDALLSAEDICRIVGTDFNGYELTGLEKVRQNYLNSIRKMNLKFYEIPKPLPIEKMDDVCQEFKAYFLLHQPEYLYEPYTRKKTKNIDIDID